LEIRVSGTIGTGTKLFEKKDAETWRQSDESYPDIDLRQ